MQKLQKTYNKFLGKVAYISDKLHQNKITSKILKILKNYARIILSFMVVAWIVITITFLLIHSLPGSAITGNLDDQQRHLLEIKYGLDKSLFSQYWIFIGNLFKGDLGTSITVDAGTPITDFLWKKMAVSFKIGAIALLLGVSVGILLGIVIGIKPGGWADNLGTIFISLGIAIPSFVAALLLVLFGKEIGIPFIYDRHNMLSILLPAIAMAVTTIIVYMRYIRVEFSEQFSSQHYKFMKARGVGKMRFIFRHALKPALFPVVSYLPGALLGTFVGSMFVEGIFGIPGSGGLMLDAINSKDYNIVQALVVLYTGMTVISFILRDIMYRLLDPRVRG